MKRAVIFLLAVLIMVSALPLASHAGPWTLKKGKVWTESYLRYALSKDYFDSHGDRHKWEDGGNSEIWDLEQKFEYGVTDNLDVHLGIPYAWSRWKNDWSKTQWGYKQKHEGFKQINFTGKYKFMDEPLVASVQASLMIHPENTEEGKPPDLFEYGDAIEVRLLLGKSWTVMEDKLVYVAGEAGYKLRSDWIHKAEYANVFPVFVEGGFAPNDDFMFKAELDTNWSHHGTGKIKDTCTWRAGVIINLMGQGFNSITKGAGSEDSGKSIDLELQYGQTFWARGDATYEKYAKVGAYQEFVGKIQILW